MGFLWLLLAATALPAFVAGILSYRQFLRASEEYLWEELDKYRYQFGDVGEAFEWFFVPPLGLLAENRETRLFFSNPQEKEGLTEYIYRFFRTYGNWYLQVVYIDSSGRVLLRARRPKGSTKPLVTWGGPRWKVETLKGLRGDSITTLPRRAHDFVIRLCRRAGPGFVIADVDIENPFLEKMRRVFEERRFFSALVDNGNGRIILHSWPFYIHKPLAQVYPDLAKVLHRSGSGHIKFKVDGEEWLASYVNLKTPDWTALFAASARRQIGWAFTAAKVSLWATAGFIALAMAAVFSLWRALRARTEELTRAYRELQEAEARLVHSEKMRALGDLVAGLAHQMNNPLGFLYANLHYIKRELEGIRASASEEKFSRVERLLEGSKEGARRLKEIVEALRNFSRAGEVERKPVDIHKCIDDTLTLLTHRLKDRIKVHKEYGDLPPVVCDPGQMNQVWMNLLANAIEAIKGEGEIWIRTGVRDKEVFVSVQDTGRGIPPEHRGKLFAPFFTTKEKGLGLGLSVSYGIVKRHGGRIEVESEVGKGSTFTVWLPLEG